MKEKVESIKSQLLEDIKNVKTTQDLVDIKAKYIGKSGLITDLMKNMKDYSPEERKEIGQIVNVAKNEATEIIGTKEEEINNAILNEKLEKESIDITLPATEIKAGAPNILEKVVEDFEEVFMSMGYDVYDGPEVEEDRFNFELLNIPKGHPARDAQDTFYIKDDEVLLRSQTSPVQARVMLEKGGNEPIRMICPGKTYRRDDDDATHSHQFSQVEGLVVGENISLSDLKGTLELFAKKMFGESREIRFRASFFPFTEPSYEVDVSCFKCDKKGCNICKGTGWIEILGCGMVHPNVLENCGFDHTKYQGFAFGVGIERVASLKYGVTNIRDYFTNDYRFLKNFDRKEI